jgi:hypothetical protein
MLLFLKWNRQGLFNYTIFNCSHLTTFLKRSFFSNVLSELPVLTIENSHYNQVKDKKWIKNGWKIIKFKYGFCVITFVIDKCSFCIFDTKILGTESKFGLIWVLLSNQNIFHTKQQKFAKMPSNNIHHITATAYFNIQLAPI